MPHARTVRGLVPLLLQKIYMPQKTIIPNRGKYHSPRAFVQELTASRNITWRTIIILFLFFPSDRFADPSQREDIPGDGGDIASPQGQPVGTRGRDVQPVGLLPSPDTQVRKSSRTLRAFVAADAAVVLFAMR